ncbi:hypothetical protein JB92DRAFT_2827345 [Gautieria morchelliformis]|nr:hypothetical protein JB92DRAFT_2827345 [Gautieria morchelliformis]
MLGIAWNGGTPTAAAGGGSAAAYVQHPGAASGGMFDHQHHWSMGAGAHKFELLEPDGVYAPFPPPMQSAVPDARGYGGGGAYPLLSPPHHSFAGPPSTPSSSSAGRFGDRDSPSGDGGSGGAGSVGGYSPNMDAHAHVRQQVPPLHSHHGYPTHAAGGGGGGFPEYDMGEFGVRGQPLQPPRIAPFEHMAARYQRVPALKSVPGAREECAQGVGGEGGDAARRYPTLPSFHSVVAATALDKSPVSPPPDKDTDAEDKDTLSTLRTSGDPELKLHKCSLIPQHMS